MRRPALFFFLLLSALSASAQPKISIAIDSTTARAILGAFEKKSITDEELAAMQQLGGVQALIHQAGRFDKNATPEAFAATLTNAVAGGKPSPDPFAFARVAARAEATRKLLASIEADPKKLESAIAARIAPYAPQDAQLQATVHLIAGGTSDGFVPGGSDLYIALDYLQDDFDGLALMTAHEVYHTLQNQVAAPAVKREGRLAEAAALLRPLLSEGTASMVGDPLTVASPKAYTAWFSDKYNRNFRRIEQNFALFETMLFALANDPAASMDRLYNLGYSGTWDSPLYFVGYRMAKVIERNDGRGAIAKFIARDPAAFVARYVELTKKDHAADVVPLSPTAEAIVGRLRP